MSTSYYTELNCNIQVFPVEPEQLNQFLNFNPPNISQIDCSKLPILLANTQPPEHFSILESSVKFPNFRRCVAGYFGHYIPRECSVGAHLRGNRVAVADFRL